MEFLTAFGVIAAALIALLVFLPIAMVHLTRAETDKDSAAYITSKYIDQIGWQSAKAQILSLYGGWLPLLVIAEKGQSIDVGLLAFLACLSAASLSWFCHSFKGLFNNQVPWHDGINFNVTILAGTLILQGAGVFSFSWSAFVGGVPAIWWAARLMMYKAIHARGA